jgi:pre-rRNA-processing protein IPI1
LSLEDVLLQVRHPNAGARKEALLNVKEVLVDGVQKGVAMGRREGETGKVFRALGGMINDDVSETR